MTGIFGRRAAVAAIAVLAATATSARAGFMGAEASSRYYVGGGSTDSAVAFTVDGLTHSASYNFDVTITDTGHDTARIVYDFKQSGIWQPSEVSLDRDGLLIRNGNLLTFTGAPTILGVTLDPSSNMFDLMASSITFNADSIAINWANLPFSQNTRVMLNVAMVSEPPALAMAGLAALGLAGAAALRRRRGAEVA